MGSNSKVILDPVNTLAQERPWLDITDHTNNPSEESWVLKRLFMRYNWPMEYFLCPRAASDRSFKHIHIISFQ